MLLNTILLAVRDIKRNVMRSVLTILGIIIGVAAVITLVTIGNGTTAQVTEQIASMGTNMLLVIPGKRQGPGQSSNSSPFDMADAEAIGREISHITAVAPSCSQAVTAVLGNKNWMTTITGSTNGFFEVRNWPVENGRPFLESEQKTGKAVCIVGATVVKKLFGSQDPIGNKIRLGNVSCQVVGVLEAKGQSTMGSDQDDMVLLPLRTAQRRITGNKDIPLIQISVQDGFSTEMVQQDIENLMRKRRHIAQNEDDNFSVLDMKELAKMLTGTTQMMTALLGAVAAVSLLVGGIGIMNIMLVSVTERTREIGIRLAIGAFEREVLMQFLVEAVVLSLFGGLFGILLALAGSVGLSRILHVPFVFDASIVLIAFLFSGAVGVIFGYFPAVKAARLDPIEALRHE